MPPLPPVPSFETEADPDATKAPAAPSPIPGPGEGVLPAPAPAAGAPEAPAPVPAPGEPPNAASSEPGVTLGDTGVQDSVEEVLQQASEQTLRLSHLEDILAALNQTLTDLRDEMHAGFSEMRALADQESTRLTEANSTTSLTERLDFVEEQTTGAAKKMSALMLVAVIQAALLIITLAVVVASRDSDTPAPAMPAYMSTDVKPEPTVRPEPPPLDLRPKAKRRKRRR